MPAFVISEVEVLDAEAMAEYRRLASPSIARFGGRYLVRGGATTLMEGGPPPKMLVIVEFPSMAVAEAWYASAEYAQALAVRGKALTRRLVFAEGV